MSRSSAIAAVLGVGVIALLAGCGATAPGSGGNSGGSGNQASTPTQAPTTTPNPLILAPATTPSTVGICSQQMSFGADGNASPIVCSNGAINVVAWNYLEPNAPALFAAGADASEGQVQNLVSQLTGPIPSNESEYCLVQAYYGWSFAINLDPASQALPGATCASDIADWP